MSNEAVFAALANVRRSLAQLARVPSAASSGAAGAIQALIGEQFARGTDPYGAGWQALAESTVRRKGGDDRILIRTGDMMSGVSVQPMSGAGISITFEQDYSAYHQVGTGRMPARPVLPDQRGLPDSWREAIAEAVRAKGEEAMR